MVDGPRMARGLVALCARQGALTWGCKSPTGTADIAYEATTLGERESILKAQYLHGKRGRARIG